MSLLHAILLGIIQGLTEFFPVSSSAHLKLAEMFLGVSDVPTIFHLACHLGSLLALVWFFKGEIFSLLGKNHSQLFYFFIALLPLIPSYFLLAKLRQLTSNPQFLGLFLIVTGGILLLGQRLRFPSGGSRWRDVLLIGTMQSAALFPGISRSASTISCATALGWTTQESVRFSFLLAIPTIMGGSLLEMQKLWKKGEMAQLMHTHCLVGCAVSFLVGMLVIRFAISWLEKGNLKPFAWYCVVLGILTNLYMFLRA